ncbi:MAG TPA: toast rack family protein [Verrucomicrobiae bacterium]|nr:toast rack family protein [Verrucomicrobiae bacterium]
MNCRNLAGGAASAMLLLSSCVLNVDHAGPTQYESKSFDRGAVDDLHLELNMGAGDLKVGTGTHKLAQAYFTYNMDSDKPEVNFDASGHNGTLTIRQPGSRHGNVHMQPIKYSWDLRLAQDVPVSLRINFGAGQAQLDLGRLALRDVQVDMGVGEMQMDLRGEPKHDYSVRIHGGVGEATVHLPANVGVSADASGGIGNIDAENLRGSHGHWVNDAFDHSPVHIHVTVEGGIGNIRLIGE